jgi:hypothetical protein
VIFFPIIFVFYLLLVNFLWSSSPASGCRPVKPHYLNLVYFVVDLFSTLFFSASLDSCILIMYTTHFNIINLHNSCNT